MPPSLANYLPIVLAAGKGNRMLSLTEHIPKALLPVANIPLFWFPLSFVQRNGFQECLLVVSKAEHSNVERLLQSGSLPELKGLDIQIVSIAEDEIGEDVDQLGTADVLRHILPNIRNENILVVSGDFVTDLSIGQMLKFHEERDSAFTCLLTDCALNGPVPGTKERAKKYRDLLMFSPKSNQLLFMADEEDFEKEELFSESLFRCSPHNLATAAYKDVHLYVVKREMLAILVKQRSHTSLKADFVPTILSGQFSKAKRHSLGVDRPYKCYCYLMTNTKEDCTLLAQCNHIGAYFEVNKLIQKVLPTIQPREAMPISPDKQPGPLCSDSVVSCNAVLGDKCQVKRSIVGDRCVLGQGTKIDNSLIMQGVTIHAGAIVKNSIVFNDAEVGEKASLTMCIVAPRQKIREKVKLSAVTISESEQREMDIGE